VGRDLDKFLAAPDRIGSRARVVAALDRGKVFVNGSEVAIDGAATRLVPGDAVHVWMDRPGSAKRRPGSFDSADLHIVYEDDTLIVLNKPAGLLAVPLERKAGASSIYDQIEDHLRSHGKRRPCVVHRIDRDTSGLVVFAKTTRAQAHLKSQFRRREPERVYLAVVYGHPRPMAGTWRDRLVWDTKALIQKQTHIDDPKGAEAISEYRVLETFRETSLVEVRLHTGKRNQIRIQARLRGHTLVGERRYVFGPEAIRPVAFARQALHAYRLAFRHPSDDRPLMYEAPPPADFTELLGRLRRRAG
jgi:23S rRNA pseudouridine1911/1915/1917 synthase